jgi:hypothetical protein
VRERRGWKKASGDRMGKKYENKIVWNKKASAMKWGFTVG